MRLLTRQRFIAAVGLYLGSHVGPSNGTRPYPQTFFPDYHILNSLETIGNRWSDRGSRRVSQILDPVQLSSSPNSDIRHVGT